MTETLTPVEVANTKELSVWELKPSDREFVFDVIAGKTLTDAWNDTHPACTRESARREGSRAMRRVDIRAAIDEIQREEGYMALASLKGMRNLAINTLRKAAYNEDISPTAVNAALAILDRSGITARSVTALELVDARREDSLDALLSGDEAC